MNTQQMFEKVATHLLKQGCQSTDDTWGDCLYRGENGTMCAAGVLIDDEHYNYKLEYTVATQQPVKDVLIKSGVNPSDIGLVRELQCVHDNTPVGEWKTDLIRIGKGHKLSVEFIHTL